MFYSNVIFNVKDMFADDEASEMPPKYIIPSTVGNKAYVTLEQNCLDREEERGRPKEVCLVGAGGGGYCRGRVSC